MQKILIISLFFLIFTGCEAALLISPIVNGVIMWKEGEAHKYYNEEVITLYRATKTSLKEMDFTINKDVLDENGNYHINAIEENLLSSNGKGNFKITIQKVKLNTAEIKIRVDFMGNKEYAELLYKNIDNNTNTIQFNDQGKPTKNKIFRFNKPS